MALNHLIRKVWLISRTKPQMYLGVVLCMKKLILARTGVRKNSTVACGFSPINLLF